MSDRERALEIPRRLFSRREYRSEMMMNGAGFFLSVHRVQTLSQSHPIDSPHEPITLRTFHCAANHPEVEAIYLYCPL